MQQEFAIMTGALDAMVVDVQCIMQAIVETSKRISHESHHHL